MARSPSPVRFFREQARVFHSVFRSPGPAEGREGIDGYTKRFLLILLLYLPLLLFLVLFLVAAILPLSYRYLMPILPVSYRYLTRNIRNLNHCFYIHFGTSNISVLYTHYCTNLTPRLQ